MKTNDFWRLIEDAHVNAKGNSEQQYRLIDEQLGNSPASEIIDFETILKEQLRRADQFKMMEAAFIVASYVSDDTFEDFRAWLISLGKEKFERALDDPESIADLLTREQALEITGDGLVTAAFMAYKKVTKTEDLYEHVEMQPDPEYPFDWPETIEQYQAKYPRLFAKLWNQKRINELHPPRN